MTTTFATHHLTANLRVFSMPHHSLHPLSRLGAVVLLLIAMVGLGGCEAVGMVASAIVPPRVAAVYPITDLPTVVIVDDPKTMLRDPQLALLAAASCTQVLASEGVIAQMIPTEKLTALMIELGDRYNKTSPHDLGRRLGAQQVILGHVFAQSDSEEPGVIRPVADIGIKLFDVDGNQRLFPASSVSLGTPDGRESAGYYPRQVALRHRVTDANPNRVISIAREKLAQEIGVRTALLFFKHDPTKYDDIRTGP